MRKYETKLISKKNVASSTIEMVFSRPDGFDFLAGQYIQLGVPELRYPDAAGRSRVMSITSSPLKRNELCIAFRDTGSGYKETLKQLQIGDSAIIEGPYGFFTLTEQVSYPLIFIAGGIGITPYISMLRYAVATNLDVSITLLYANSSPENAAYIKELKDIVRRNARLRFTPTYDRIDERFLVEHVTEPYESVWFISGPPAMVAHVKNLLYLRGIDSNKICIEEFTGY